MPCAISNQPTVLSCYHAIMVIPILTLDSDLVAVLFDWQIPASLTGLSSLSNQAIDDMIVGFIFNKFE